MLLVAVILATFVYGIASAMLGTLLPAFGFSASESGGIALAQSVGLMIASLSSGPIIDQFGKKRPLVGGLFLMACMLWMLPGVSTSAVAALVLFILGLGGGIMVNAVNSQVSAIGADRRASLLAFTNLFFGLGLMVTPWVSTLVRNDAKQLCYLAAGLATFTGIVQTLTRSPLATSEHQFQIAEARGLLKSPVLWLLAGTVCLYVACEVGLSNWLASYLILKGLPRDEALNIMAWRFGLGLLLGRLAIAPVMLKVNPRVVLPLASVCMAATSYWILQTTSPAVAVFFTGVAMAPVFPSALAIVGDQFPQATATAMGIVITFGWIGLTVSSPVIGLIADRSSLGQALLLFPAFSVGMLLLTLALRTVRR